MIALHVTGCASTRSRPDAVRQLSGLTIAVDSTALEGRSFKHNLINVPQNLAVLMIQAKGKYISNLAVAGNVAQAAMLPLLIFTGGRGADKLDFSMDSLALNAYIVDMEKGEVLWAESLGKFNAPEGDNFLKFIEKVLTVC